MERSWDSVTFLTLQARRVFGTGLAPALTTIVWNDEKETTGLGQGVDLQRMNIRKLHIIREWEKERDVINIMYSVQQIPRIDLLMNDSKETVHAKQTFKSLQNYPITVCNQTHSNNLRLQRVTTSVSLSLSKDRNTFQQRKNTAENPRFNSEILGTSTLYQFAFRTKDEAGLRQLINYQSRDCLCID